MEAAELRIGNLIGVNGVIDKILIISEYSIEFDSTILNSSPKSIKPIPLTEEWLLKFGFEKMDFDMSGCNVWQLGKIRILKSFIREADYSVCIDGISPPTWSIASLKHVHQLQNLYFALTNTELIIQDGK
jgi:hypothetical protein